MAEKVNKLGLERDYKQYLYFIDKEGNVARKQKTGEKLEEVVAKHAVTREKGFLYFIDKEGDVSRTASKSAKSADDGSK